MPLFLITSDIAKACNLARHFELKGEYQRAAEQLHYFWEGVGTRPKTAGLSDEDAAELLLRAGSLTGWIGAAQKMRGAQSLARDLLSEAMRTSSDADKILECKNEVASSYWREGDFKAASTVAFAALSEARVGTPQRLGLVNVLAMVEIQQGNFKLAGDLLGAHADEARDVNFPYGRAVFHNQSGFVCKRRAEESQEEEERAELLDRALIEYEGACHFFEEIGHISHKARVKNNIATTLIVKGKPGLAHPYIQDAIEIAKQARDSSLLGSFEETRAQVLLAEGNLTGALVAIKSSLTHFQGGEQLALQAESEATHGVILARMGDKECADSAFEHAISLAETAQISTVKIRLTQLREMMELHKAEALRYEKEWVQSALEAANKHPSNAAKLIGIKHQTFINKIKRFKLNDARSPVYERRKKARQ